MKNRNLFIPLIVLIIVAGAYWYATWRADISKETARNNSTVNQNPSNNRVAAPETEQPTSPASPATEGKLKAANFSGTLEKVDTGCFADGECYVVVDGKHITTTMGWSRETVGSVQGVAGFGDLEQHIGQPVEVYAQDKGDGTYTLYGSEGFYVKLK